MPKLFDVMAAELERQAVELRADVARISDGTARYQVNDTANVWTDCTHEMAHRFRNVIATYEAMLIAIRSV